MAENSKIEWCHHTFNPWRGCAKVHTGCANCYAAREAKRFPKLRGIWGDNGTRVVASEDMWRQPLKWNRQAAKAGERHRVFCASLADVFEDWQGPIVNSNGNVLQVSPFKVGPPWCFEVDGRDGRPPNLTLDDVRRRLFALIDATPNLDWLLLTKRPENVWRMWPPAIPGSPLYVRNREQYDLGNVGNLALRPNVWLGTSISDQETTDKAIPELLKCRDLSPVLFLSAEPLVGPLEFSDVSQRSDCIAMLGKPALHGIDWVIVGGESGHGARPCNVAWIRSIVEQCKAAGVACFVKQLGAMPLPEFITQAARVFGGGTVQVPEKSPLKHPKGGDWDEWPEDLRVREFPGVEVAHG